MLLHLLAARSKIDLFYIWNHKISLSNKNYLEKNTIKESGKGNNNEWQ